MSKVVLYMSMSVDGFITGPDDSVDHGLGVDGERLHDWIQFPAGDVDLRTHRPVGPSATVVDELVATGAVITGRRTFELAGRWGGDHHDGVPIFVLTRAAPDEPAPGHAHYVTDIDSCVAQAKAAAGGRDIMLHGAATAQECLRAGLLDEMELHLVPVLLGQGRRLFADLPPDHIERRAGTARRTGPARAGAPAVRQPAGRARRADPGPPADHSGGRGPRAARPAPALPRSLPPLDRLRHGETIRTVPTRHDRRPVT